MHCPLSGVAWENGTNSGHELGIALRSGLGKLDVTKELSYVPQIVLKVTVYIAMFLLA
jgi:hypothetical protein